MAQCLVAFHAPADLVAIDARDHQVQDDQVERLLDASRLRGRTAQFVQCFLTIERPDRLVALCAQQLSDVIGSLKVIVYDQNSFLTGHPSPAFKGRGCFPL